MSYGQAMKEEWKSAKATLEQDFEYIHRKKVSLTDLEVFAGLLFCFDVAAFEGAGHGFARAFDEDDVEEMRQR